MTTESLVPNLSPDISVQPLRHSTHLKHPLHGIKITCCHLAPISPLLAKVLSQVHDTPFLILFLIPTYLLLTAIF